MSPRARRQLFAAKEFFAVILEPKAKGPRILLATATTLAVALAIPLIHLHHDQPTIAGQSTSQTTNSTQHGVILRRASRGLLREALQKDLSAVRVTTPVQRLPTSTSDDSEAIALAETLAPSHPIPPQPLTPQEHILQGATRRTQPLEVAELELTRAPFHRAAAHARELFTFAQVARGLLAPLAAAEAIEPITPPAEAQPAAQPDAFTEPPSSR
jgi:hypothetical protein